MNPELPIPDQEEFLRAVFSAGVGIVRRIECDVNSDALSPGEFVKYARAYTEIAKLEIARERIRAAIEIANIRADAVRAAAEARASRGNRDEWDENDAEAPWGRKKDGTPYTHGEFVAQLGHAVQDIYGIDLPLHRTPFENAPPPGFPPPLKRNKPEWKWSSHRPEVEPPPSTDGAPSSEGDLGEAELAKDSEATVGDRSMAAQSRGHATDAQGRGHATDAQGRDHGTDAEDDPNTRGVAQCSVKIPPSAFAGGPEKRPAPRSEAFHPKPRNPWVDF
jgi:hypothetical protein